MAHGTIDIENIGTQANLAAGQLGTQHYAGHVGAAQHEASDLPDLGQELGAVWKEIAELTLELQASNNQARDGMDQAHKTMFGNPDAGEAGVIVYAESLLEGSSAPGLEIRNQVNALGASTTPVLDRYKAATVSAETLKQDAAGSNEAVQRVGMLAAKLSQRRFGRLVQIANGASDKLGDYVKEI